MKCKLNVTLSIIVALSIIILAITGNYYKNLIIKNSNYTYEKERVIKNSAVTDNVISSEEQNFSLVKSSSHYYMQPISIDFVSKSDRNIKYDNEEAINCDGYPFVINDVTYNNTGIFINMEFKDSGYISDFQMTLTILDTEKICKIDLIDCSNQFVVYIPFDFRQVEDMSDFKIKLSNFAWKPVKMKKIAIIDFDKKMATFQEKSEKEKIISKVNDNMFTLDYTKNVKNNSKFKCKLEKQSYNSLHLKTYRYFNNMLNKFLNMFTKSKSSKFSLICMNNHVQTDCVSLRCNQIIDKVFCFNSNIGQVKILVECDD